ncbi:family 10 glycosylhydrolase [Olivibacter sp. SDN3]|uniref:glycoside hydrolase family 10 protein n=1 Tax=Olivibacter sp. SDN3 TaxID=2764720 RepID=UPI0016513C16|nr:family 10 glycosylhydrolase [Olivibacter sp. SDN3]QNL51130.1 family 10 glycosylhydrolase [Olivibacter sp. SDN3]
MNFRKSSIIIIITIVFQFTLGCHAYAQRSDLQIPKRELRGVWVASVANIDWPSKPGLTTNEQKQELLRLLDAHQRAGLNAVFLQIRPSADAIYLKGEELWSRFLTGKQGFAPSPIYDPLEFAIEEAHNRGMELHAWFNPYRATFDLSEANVSPKHITKRHPEWFFTYAGKRLFNPGIPEVQQYIVSVILSVVKNYDIDGVHFDDYFYPYPAAGQTIPDIQTFNKYGRGHKRIDDWRRNNVNHLIKTLSDSIHHEKKHVKFGISPFGIWQNRKQHPEGSETSGLSGYSQLYADARAWLQQGWIDYVNPQVYFPFNNRAAAYEILLDWWSKNAFGKHVYIGHAAYRAADNSPGWKNRDQLPEQLRHLRRNPLVQGSVYFSSKSLVNNLAGFRDSLQYNFYRYKALPPTMPWIDSIPPMAPKNLVYNILTGSGISLRWAIPEKAIDNDEAYGYVVYRFNAGEEINLENTRNILEIIYDVNRNFFTDQSVRQGLQYTYVVTAIDRMKNESEPSNMQVVVAN